MRTDTAVPVPAGGVVLTGDLTVVDRTTGVVLFAHGSGSSRHSPRNRMVAARLQGVGLSTLLVDLLTEDEERLDERTAELRFDIGLLAGRLSLIVDWLGGQPDTAGHPLGLFGASTGAAAALVATASRPKAVRAVVSRGGRPDLAGDDLERVPAPTLLIVGEHDPTVVELNERAARQLAGPTQVRVVPRATHLFEEPGALEQVAGWAAEWFARYLAGTDLTTDGYLPGPGRGGGSHDELRG